MGDVDILEAAYELEQGDNEWLTRIIGEVKAILGGVEGVGWFASAPDFHPYSCSPFDGRGYTIEVAENIARIAPQLMGLVLKNRSCGLGTCSEDLAAFGLDIVNQSATHQFAHPHGLKDFLCARAMCPSGVGMVVGTSLREVQVVDDRARARWSRVCAHLTSALRLRRYFATSSEPEAVLRPNGEVEHAEGQAKTRSALEALRNAVRTVDNARTRAARNEPDALAHWQALVAGRWTLLDRFEENGRRYVVARANEPRVKSNKKLSRRELQVAAYAALGHSQKQIAYDLGLAQSTVQGHLKQAVTKLGLRAPLELGQLFAPWRRHDFKEESDEPQADVT